MLNYQRVTGLTSEMRISAPSLGLHSILVGEVRLEGVQLLIFRLIGENGCLGHGLAAW